MWTRIVVADCGIDDVEGLVNVGDSVKLTCDATYEHNATVKVPSAKVDVAAALPSGCDQASGGITDGVLTAVVHCGVRANLTGANEVVLTVASASDEVPDFLGAIKLASKWAEIEFVNLATSPSTAGWYNATDEVEFSFVAEFVYGAGALDREPVDGATFTLTAGDVVKEIVTDGAGEGVTPLKFDSVNVVIPALAVVSSPEFVTDFVANDYSRQRWTEMDLGVSVSDDFVNVGDAVTMSLTAFWAHDEDENGIAGDDPVGTATVLVLDSANGTVASCGVESGAGSCVLAKPAVYSTGLTAVVDVSVTGVTCQLLGTDETVGVIWTELVMEGLEVNDDFVNVEDTITFTGRASYAHDRELLVPSATVVLAIGAPESCALSEGSVTAGSLTIKVNCTGVVDSNIPFRIETADEDVTRLAAPLGFEAVWTELVVSYTVDIPDGSLLDHNDPVVFTGTMRFAHDIVNGTSPPAGTFFAFFVKSVKDGEEFNCVSDLDDESCPLEVSKASGKYDFTVTASSITDLDGDGTVERDITRMSAVLPPVSYRWTSIGFNAFECSTTRNATHACGTIEYSSGELVTVKVKAVAQDDPSEVLSGARITIAGKSFTTDASGMASRQFVRFTAGCVTVTARGLEATIGATTVTWDTPRSESVCWS